MDTFKTAATTPQLTKGFIIEMCTAEARKNLRSIGPKLQTFVPMRSGGWKMLIMLATHKIIVMYVDLNADLQTPRPLAYLHYLN